MGKIEFNLNKQTVFNAISVALALGVGLGSTGCAGNSELPSPAVAIMKERSIDLADKVVSAEEIEMIRKNPNSAEAKKITDGLILSDEETQVVQKCLADVNCVGANLFGGGDPETLKAVWSAALKLGAQTVIHASIDFPEGKISAFDSTANEINALGALKGKSVAELSVAYPTKGQGYVDLAGTMYVESRLFRAFSVGSGFATDKFKQAAVELADMASLLAKTYQVRGMKSALSAQARLANEESNWPTVLEKYQQDPNQKFTTAEITTLEDYTLSTRFHDALGLSRAIKEWFPQIGAPEKTPSVPLTGDALVNFKKDLSVTRNKSEAKDVIMQYKKYLVALKQQASSISDAEAEKQVAAELSKLTDPPSTMAALFQKILFPIFLTNYVGELNMPLDEAWNLAGTMAESVALKTDKYLPEAIAVPEQSLTLSKEYLEPDKNGLPTKVKLQFLARAPRNPGQLPNEPELQTQIIPLPKLKDGTYADFARIGYFNVNGKDPQTQADSMYMIMAAVFEGYDDANFDARRSFVVPFRQDWSQGTYLARQEVFGSELTAILGERVGIVGDQGDKNFRYEVTDRSVAQRVGLPWHQTYLNLPKSFVGEYEFKTKEPALKSGVPLRLAADALAEKIIASETFGLDEFSNLPTAMKVGEQFTCQTAEIHQPAPLMIAKFVSGAWQLSPFLDSDNNQVMVPANETLAIPIEPKRLDQFFEPFQENGNLVSLKTKDKNQTHKYVKLKELTPDTFLVLEYSDKVGVTIGYQFTPSQLADVALGISKPLTIFMSIPVELSRYDFAYGHPANPMEIKAPLTLAQGFTPENTWYRMSMMQSEREAYQFLAGGAKIELPIAGTILDEIPESLTGLYVQTSTRNYFVQAQPSSFVWSLTDTQIQKNMQYLIYFGALKVTGAAFNSFDLRGLPSWQPAVMAINASKIGLPSNKILKLSVAIKK